MEVRETYDELALARHVAVADAHEGVVVLAFAERGGVVVGCEEADGGADSGVEGGLELGLGVSRRVSVVEHGVRTRNAWRIVRMVSRGEDG